MLEKQYSGDHSEAFWEIVHLVDDSEHTLYDLGCQLQTLEGKVLVAIERQLIERLKTAYNKKHIKQYSP
jgi:hypothetical protein